MSPEISARRQLIKNKILAVGRLQKVLNVLRYVARMEVNGLSDAIAATSHRGSRRSHGVISCWPSPESARFRTPWSARRP